MPAIIEIEPRPPRPQLLFPHHSDKYPRAQPKGLSARVWTATIALVPWSAMESLLSLLHSPANVTTSRPKFLLGPNSVLPDPHGNMVHHVKIHRNAACHATASGKHSAEALSSLINGGELILVTSWSSKVG
jgi:hypothetical protein